MDQSTVDLWILLTDKFLQILERAVSGAQKRCLHAPVPPACSLEDEVGDGA